jgi:hypothetical protein
LVLPRQASAVLPKEALDGGQTRREELLGSVIVSSKARCRKTAWPRGSPTAKRVCLTNKGATAAGLIL